MRKVLLVVALLIAGCTAPADPPAASSDEELTNATPTTGFPAVTQLVIDGRHWCTATLIAPQVLLTAAHCVHYTNASIGASFGGTWYAADRWYWNNGYADPGSGPNAPVGLEGNIDIAVVHLGRPVVGVTPLRVAQRMPRPSEPFTMVGYGESYSGEGNFRVKRTASAKAGTIAGTWFYGSSVSSPCHADSGGPAIASDGTVLGVFARMYNDCRGGPDSFSYVALGATARWVTTRF